MSQDRKYRNIPVVDQGIIVDGTGQKSNVTSIERSIDTFAKISALFIIALLRLCRVECDLFCQQSVKVVWIIVDGVVSETRVLWTLGIGTAVWLIESNASASISFASSTRVNN